MSQIQRFSDTGGHSHGWVTIIWNYEPDLVEEIDQVDVSSAAEICISQVDPK
jgi:hypothetical protein